MGSPMTTVSTTTTVTATTMSAKATGPSTSLTTTSTLAAVTNTGTTTAASTTVTATPLASTTLATTTSQPTSSTTTQTTSIFLPNCIVESDALDHTTGDAVSTTCPANMTHMQSCEAVCAESVKAEGTIKCMSGRLVDTSHCLTNAGFSTQTVTKVFGTFELEVTGVPTVLALTAAVVEAFGVDEEYVSIAFSTVAGTGGRLLSVFRNAPLRLLASKVAVEYGVVVVSVSHGADPVTVQSVIVRDASGTVVKPTQGAPVDAIVPNDDSDVDVAAVVGGVVAGLAVLAFLGVLMHYFMLRRKADASDEMVSDFAV